MQPAGERFDAGEARGFARERHKNILRNLLGHAPVAELTERGGIDHIDMPGDQRAEGGFRPFGGVISHKLYVRRRGHYSTGKLPQGRGTGQSFLDDMPGGRRKGADRCRVSRQSPALPELRAKRAGFQQHSVDNPPGK